MEKSQNIWKLKRKSQEKFKNILDNEKENGTY